MWMWIVVVSCCRDRFWTEQSLVATKTRDKTLLPFHSHPLSLCLSHFSFCFFLSLCRVEFNWISNETTFLASVASQHFMVESKCMPYIEVAPKRTTNGNLRMALSHGPRTPDNRQHTLRGDGSLVIFFSFSSLCEQHFPFPSILLWNLAHFLLCSWNCRAADDDRRQNDDADVRRPWRYALRYLAVVSSASISLSHSTS